MKKTLLTVIVTMCVMFIVGMAYITKIEKSYESKLEEAKTMYELEIQKMSNDKKDLSKDMNELTDDYTELETQVWNMMNDQAYEIRVHHDDATYIWESDNKGLFPSKSTTVIW